MFKHIDTFLYNGIALMIAVIIFIVVLPWELFRKSKATD
jgi:hypothetical protein